MSEREPLLNALDGEIAVYPIIHIIRSDVINYIDTPLSFEALTAPDLTYTLIRPLFEKYVAYQRAGNMSVVFCLLLNRVHFVRDKSIATASISQSRATLCEIIAIRVLKDLSHSMLNITLALTTSWPVFSGADPQVLQAAREEREDDLEERVGNAIEIAIVGKAKLFIKSSACQKVIDGIWTGRCVYQAESNHSILSDTYKRTPVHFYDPHKAPLLDHYRLKVPAIRSVLEYINFLILFILFVVAIELNTLETINLPEALFMVYALGFTLEKAAAMQEHGIKVYFKGTWNGFDLAFVTTYCIYATLRVYGVAHDERWARTFGIDCLAIIACLLFPRLAFVTFKNNLMVLSLRSMMVQFMVLMMIATFCFGGFLYALWTLSRNEANYSAGTIAWWMLDLWFGLDASGFDKATEFHQIFGPILMVTYACLSNTLLLTVLVSILSNTFSRISQDAAAEAMFRRAVSTIEGVKADSLFSYQPPVNLLALSVLLPMSYVLTPRWFHKVNVFMIRLTSFPILLLIAVYERQSKQSGTTGFRETFSALIEALMDRLPRHLKRLTFFEGLAGSDSDIDAVFEIQDEYDASALDTGDDHGLPRSTGYELHTRRLSNRSNHGPALAANTDAAESQPPANHNNMSAPAPIPRARLNSLMSRGLLAGVPQQTFTSPLAQIYQPLVVDEEEPAALEGSPRTPETGTSPPQPQYMPGHSPPGYRRRILSMQSVHRRDGSTSFPYVHHQQGPFGQSQAQQQLGTGLRRIPGSELPGALSESPKSAGSMQMRPVGDDEKRDATDLNAKLAAIEKRQEKMEQMLIRLLDGMNHAGERNID